MKEYKTVVADPPWKPKLGGTWTARHDRARPQKFYDTMNLTDIKNLVIPTGEQAHLYIWVISQHIDWGFETARSWGFDPIITLTWAKPGLGVGRFRCNTEHIVVARKGLPKGMAFGYSGQTGQATRGTWFNWPRGKHSEKPDEFFCLVEEISPGPYLEMFARKPRVGWDVWGNEVISDINVKSDQQLKLLP